MPLKILLVFLLSFLGTLAFAGPCEEIFSDPDSFNQAMTKRLELGPHQDSLFKLYQESSLIYPKEDGHHSLSDVLKILKNYPQLSKLPLRDQIITFSVKKRTTPESLKNFINSFRKKASQVQDQLFNIESHLSVWSKILTTQLPPSPPSPASSLNPQAQSARKQEKKRGGVRVFKHHSFK